MHEHLRRNEIARYCSFLNPKQDVIPSASFIVSRAMQNLLGQFLYIW